MIIRPLKKEDIYNGFLETLQSLSPSSDSKTAESIFELLTINTWIKIFVAENQHGRIVGTVTLLVEQKFIHNSGKVAHIEDVSVASDHQKQGIGDLLMKYVVEEAKRENCYKIILNCTKELAERFYSKFGFKESNIEMRLNC